MNIRADTSDGGPGVVIITTTPREARSLAAVLDLADSVVTSVAVDELSNVLATTEALRVAADEADQT